MSRLGHGFIDFAASVNKSLLRTNSEEASDIDAVTQDLFHHPTLTENDIAERLVIEPFPEGAETCR